MKFGSGYYSHQPIVDYFNAMDPQTYDQKAPEGSSHGHRDHEESHGEYHGAELGIKDIGMSVPMGISAANVAGIYSKIRMGAGNIEIQFPGYRSGQRNAQTPEMLGEDQRQAIRELSLANEVKFNTHASFGLMGLMGRDERGNFSIYNATQDLFELKRAIDFQADLGGGSVVIHSGEFERPMTDMYLDDESGRTNLARDQSGRLLFKQAHTQELDAKFELLDDRTSQKMETVQKDRLVAVPVWLTEKKGRWGVDQDGNKVYINEGDYIDYEQKKIKLQNIYDARKGRVPVFDPDSNRFRTELKSFEYFRSEAEKWNRWFERVNERKPNYYEKRYPEESFLHATLETQEGHARGWALQYAQETGRWIKVINKLEDMKRYYDEIDKSIPESEKWKIMRQDPEFSQMTRGLLPSETKHPVDIIKDEIDQARIRLEFARQASASQEQQAEDTKETKSHLITPIKRLERQGIRLYAEAGLHAMRKTKDPESPVFVSVEHIFPERFGGHIEELKWIIKKARERMVEMLTEPTIPYGTSLSPTEVTAEKVREPDKYFRQPNPYFMGISKDEASKLAERHIKATIDTGHINLWRKYWQDDPRKSKEQNDMAFNKWITGQIESIAQEGMVGNVHLADNYGYQDDHLAPGQGNSPV
ncbi:hypothetical protein HYU10_04545, partial [Candidatus Woesearchaeota archaeon]|nr:hypothetical protein [Candidatus Woesearchaeota archaeon]